ncbi:hypothetical protein INS49_005436 [Diaporthe citri]|uniref:uncharacterized protein n=1 Tax=Diaporthe citri TaxID=83186 RepID=UPI001C7FC302|nr:uncharacterized protein INS49_005436 [Diaporthe citri]KAG6353727.1 hypothetical protein INS49_005436 [Diaporthe citri]
MGVADGVPDELDELVELDVLDLLELDELDELDELVVLELDNLDVLELDVLELDVLELDVLKLVELDVLVSGRLVVEIPVAEVLAAAEAVCVSEKRLLGLVTLSTLWRLPDERFVVSVPEVLKVLVLGALEVSVDIRLGRSVELDGRPAEVVEEELDCVVLPGASELVTDVDEGIVKLEETVPGEVEYGVGERTGCDELANAELKLDASCDDTTD